MKLTFVLKTGQEFTGVVEEGYRFGPSDLTDKTVHKIVTGKKQIVFVQGDNIAYVINKGEL